MMKWLEEIETTAGCGLVVAEMTAGNGAGNGDALVVIKRANVIGQVCTGPCLHVQVTLCARHSVWYTDKCPRCGA